MHGQAKGSAEIVFAALKGKKAKFGATRNQMRVMEAQGLTEEGCGERKPPMPAGRPRQLKISHTPQPPQQAPPAMLPLSVQPSSPPPLPPPAEPPPDKDPGRSETQSKPGVSSVSAQLGIKRGIGVPNFGNTYAAWVRVGPYHGYGTMPGSGLHARAGVLFLSLRHPYQGYSITNV